MELPLMDTNERDIPNIKKDLDTNDIPKRDLNMIDIPLNMRKCLHSKDTRLSMNDIPKKDLNTSDIPLLDMRERLLMNDIPHLHIRLVLGECLSTRGGIRKEQRLGLLEQLGRLQQSIDLLMREDPLLKSLLSKRNGFHSGIEE
jgi:hypothetical protein